jgi:uncharacterized protein YjbI with pentapeptide repeats
MMTVDGATDKYQRQAEDCAWYLLATIYGEDHPKNRFSWNRYVAAYLDDKRRTALREQGFPESELNPFTSEELVDLKSAYARRCKPGSKIDLPQPTPPFEGAPHPVIDFSHVQLDKFFRARGFLFPEMVQFWGAIFHDSASFGEATFDEAAIFGKAQFAGANFDGATFNGSAHFDDTDFQLIPPGYLSISFERAKFAQYVTFERAIISDISFANAIFSGAISRFDEAAFDDGDFSNVVFKLCSKTQPSAAQGSTAESSRAKQISVALDSATLLTLGNLLTVIDSANLPSSLEQNSIARYRSPRPPFAVGVRSSIRKWLL